MPLKVRWVRGRRATVAAVFAARTGGIALAVPVGFLAEDELEAASAEDYVGGLGPNIESGIRLFDDTGAELGTVGALLIDISDELIGELVSAVSVPRGTMLFQYGGCAGMPLLDELGEAFSLLLSDPGSPAERLAAYGDLDEPVEPAVDGLPLAREGQAGGAVAARAVPDPPAPRPERVAGRGAELREVLDQLGALRREMNDLRAEAALAGPPTPPGEPVETGGAVGAAVDPQFFAEGRRLGIDEDALRRLLESAGPRPSLADPSAKRLGAPRESPFLGRAAGSASRAPLRPAAAAPLAAAEPSPPREAPLDVTQLLLKQNEMLMALLAGKKPDDSNSVAAILGGGQAGLLDDAKVSGARGCAARVALQEQMRARPEVVVASVRKNLARALDKPLSHLVPGDMRQFLVREVPFGNYSCLTYFSFLLAKIWEESELLADLVAPGDTATPEVLRKIDELRMVVSLGLVFSEQVAVEGGAKYQLGWLLTGLEEPPFSTTTQHRPRPGTIPHGRLCEAQWVAAQLAYLRDLDLMAERMKKQGPAGAEGGHHGGGGGGGGKEKLPPK